MKTKLFYGEYQGLTEDAVMTDMEGAYGIERCNIDNYIILIASCNSYDYEEDSYFLLLSKIDGKLYENHASHCSCYGFEDQFEPEETNIPYLLSEKCNFGYGLDNERKNIQAHLVVLLRYLKLEQLKERMN